MKTRADRDKRYRANLKDKNLVTVRVIAYPEDREDILKYGRLLKEGREKLALADFMEAVE